MQSLHHDLETRSLSFTNISAFGAAAADCSKGSVISIWATTLLEDLVCLTRTRTGVLKPPTCGWCGTRVCDTSKCNAHHNTPTQLTRRRTQDYIPVPFGTAVVLLLPQQNSREGNIEASKIIRTSALPVDVNYNAARHLGISTFPFVCRQKCASLPNTQGA